MFCLFLFVSGNIIFQVYTANGLLHEKAPEMRDPPPSSISLQFSYPELRNTVNGCEADANH